MSKILTICVANFVFLVLEYCGTERDVFVVLNLEKYDSSQMRICQQHINVQLTMSYCESKRFSFLFLENALRCFFTNIELCHSRQVSHKRIAL